jgi:predicted dehydrogenase
MSNKDNNTNKIHRRDVLKSLATVPVLGAFGYSYWRRTSHREKIKNQITNTVNVSYDSPPAAAPVSRESVIKLGIIGYGIRGRHLLRAAGFAHPTWIDAVRKQSKINKSDSRYEDFLSQEDLKVKITAVCDIFDVFAEEAIEAGANLNKEGSEMKPEDKPQRYSNYKDLMASQNVDAVIIATPDHWHAPMAMEAARNGKHVYVEKPMTWTVPETYEIRDVVKKSGIVFQLGHQGRQTESYIKAQEAVEKNVLGNISLIEVTTNRNSPNGAWVYPIHPEAGPHNIDWEQFIGPAPWHDFDLKRFFRWRCWWDYSTGLNGDLLTHEYDAVNQIMKVGIPDSAASSGGIYHYKDGRTVPDVLQVAYEFPSHDMTMLYSATLASQHHRGKVFMGHDATMELGNTCIIKADPRSTQYGEKIKRGIIDPSIPIYSYVPGQKNVDAIASATEKYFAGRGLLYTYRGGRRVDTTHLHMKEWLDGIRTNKQPSCDIDQGFEEAITAHMATIALREKRTVFWDRDNEKIV